jgi:septation ring formation regulator EzrA
MPRQPKFNEVTEETTMANLDRIEEEVAGLIRDESTDFEFRDVFNDIEEAGKTATNAEIARLRNILSSFRGKIPNLISLKPIKVRAKDLADTLMLATLAERIARINARNDLLTRLTGELRTQINKANSDATLLTRIKEGVDKASKTITEVNALIDQLEASDTSTKDRLKALIRALENVSSIFAPQDA